MPAPFEIIAKPLTLYLAPVGTAFPNIDAAPAAAWVKVGTSGDKNYEEDGVTVSHDQSIEGFRPAGGTGLRKVFRTEEDLAIGVTLADLSPDQYAKAINNAAVTTVAAATGVAGQKHFSLQRGLEVALFALLARGKSTVNDAFNAQYEVPIAYEGGSPAPVHSKGAAAGLELSFMAIEDDVLGFGKLRNQTAAPL